MVLPQNQQQLVNTVLFFGLVFLVFKLFSGTIPPISPSLPQPTLIREYPSLQDEQVLSEKIAELVPHGNGTNLIRKPLPTMDNLEAESERQELPQGYVVNTATGEIITVG